MKELEKDLILLKICQYVNPIKMLGNANNDLPINFESDIRSLDGWFSEAQIKGMCSEWRNYMIEVKKLDRLEDDLDPTKLMARIELFWQENKFKFKSLATLVRFCFTLTTSSAAAERLFSVLKNAFSILQLKSALTDYTSGVIKLNYNEAFINAYPSWDEFREKGFEEFEDFRAADEDDDL